MNTDYSIGHGKHSEQLYANDINDKNDISYNNSVINNDTNDINYINDNTDRHMLTTLELIHRTRH